MANNDLTIFEGKKIRKFWENNEEKWYFSVIDIVEVLTDSAKPRDYWFKMKIRVKTEDSLELSTFCRQLKLSASDGKLRATDCADTEGIFRIIQSIPSPKAEPFKQWLARVGSERVEEVQDPELALRRALEHYRNLGRTDDWINQRLKSIEIRKDLTDEWEKRGVKTSFEFAVLTDDISRAWAGMSTKQYKQFKNLKKENLRDHMSNLELVLNMLAEASTTKISQKENPVKFSQHRGVAKRGGLVANKAREQLEIETKEKVVISNNLKKIKA